MAKFGLYNFFEPGNPAWPGSQKEAELMAVSVH
jgi:hypothetical protein